MGIFSRHRSDDTDEDGTGTGTDDTGQVSQPKGDGPVTLADRTAPGGEGSPDTNQGKTEPMSPTPGPPGAAGRARPRHDERRPAADAQAPSHPAAAPLSPPGSYGGGDDGDAAARARRAGCAAARRTGRGSTPRRAPAVSAGRRAGAAELRRGAPGRRPERRLARRARRSRPTSRPVPPAWARPRPTRSTDLSSGHGDTGGAPAPGDAALARHVRVAAEGRGHPAAGGRPARVAVAPAVEPVSTAAADVPSAPLRGPDAGAAGQPGRHGRVPHGGARALRRAAGGRAPGRPGPDGARPQLAVRPGRARPRAARRRRHRGLLRGQDAVRHRLR